MFREILLLPNTLIHPKCVMQIVVSPLYGTGQTAQIFNFTDFLPKTRVLLILSWTGLACVENFHGTWGTCGTWFLRKRFVVPGDVQYHAWAENDCGTSGSAGYGSCGNFSRYLGDLACVESFHGIFSKLFWIQDGISVFQRFVGRFIWCNFL